MSRDGVYKTITRACLAAVLSLTVCVSTAEAAGPPPPPSTPATLDDILPDCVYGLGPTGDPSIDCPDWALGIADGPYSAEMESLASAVDPVDPGNTTAGPLTAAGESAVNTLYFADGVVYQTAKIHIPNLFQLAKCIAAVNIFIIGNIYLAGKIRKAGGVIKLARVLIKARNVSQALAGVVGASAYVLDIGAIKDNC